MVAIGVCVFGAETSVTALFYFGGKLMNRAFFSFIVMVYPYVVLGLIGFCISMIVKKVKKSKKVQLKPLIAKYRENPRVIQAAHSMASSMKSTVEYRSSSAASNKYEQREITAEWKIEAKFCNAIRGNNTPCCNYINGVCGCISFTEEGLRPIYSVPEMQAFVHAIVSKGMEFFMQEVPKDPSGTDYDIDIKDIEYSAYSSKDFEINIKYVAPNGHYINPKDMAKW